MSRPLLIALTILLCLHHGFAKEVDPDDQPFIASIPLDELPETLSPAGSDPMSGLFADPFASAATRNEYKLAEHTSSPETPPYPSKFLSTGDRFIEFQPELLTKLFPDGDVEWVVYNSTTQRLVSCADLKTHDQIAKMFTVFRDSDLLKLHARLDSVPSAVALRVASGRFAHVAIPPIDPLSEITAFTRLGVKASLSNDQKSSSTRRSASLVFTPEDVLLGSSTRCAITFKSELKTQHIGELSLTLDSTLLLTYDKPVSLILGPDPERANQSLALTFTFTSQNYLGDKSITGLAPKHPEKLARILAYQGGGNLRQSAVYATDCDPQTRQLAALPDDSIIYSLAAVAGKPTSLKLTATGKRVTSAELATDALMSEDGSLLDLNLDFSQTSLKSLLDYSIKTKTSLGNGQVQHMPVTEQRDGKASLLLLAFPLDSDGTKLKSAK